MRVDHKRSQVQSLLWVTFCWIYFCSSPHKLLPNKNTRRLKCESDILLDFRDTRFYTLSPSIPYPPSLPLSAQDEAVYLYLLLLLLHPKDPDFLFVQDRHWFLTTQKGSSRSADEVGTWLCAAECQVVLRFLTADFRVAVSMLLGNVVVATDTFVVRVCSHQASASTLWWS